MGQKGEKGEKEGDEGEGREGARCCAFHTEIKTGRFAKQPHLKTML